MNLDLNKMRNGSMSIDAQVIIPSSYLVDSQIKGLKNLKLVGKAYYEDDNIILEGILSGIIVLLDSYSLDLIDYKFESQIDQIIDLGDLKSNKIIKKSENVLDITDVLWQNIVLEVPISYSKTKEVEIKQGDGWQLKDKETHQDDPRLAKLAELLDKGKE